MALALKDQLKLILQLHPLPDLASKPLQAEPLCYVSYPPGFLEGRLESTQDSSLASCIVSKENAAFAVYAQALDKSPEAQSVYIALHPVSIRGAVGEPVYRFPLLIPKIPPEAEHYATSTTPASTALQN